MSSTTTDEETRPPSSRATSVGFELDLDQMEERDIKQCLLSDTVQVRRLVFQSLCSLCLLTRLLLLFSGLSCPTGSLRHETRLEMDSAS